MRVKNGLNVGRNQISQNHFKSQSNLEIEPELCLYYDIATQRQATQKTIPQFLQVNVNYGGLLNRDIKRVRYRCRWRVLINEDHRAPRRLVINKAKISPRHERRRCN